MECIATYRKRTKPTEKREGISALFLCSHSSWAYLESGEAAQTNLLFLQHVRHVCNTKQRGLGIPSVPVSSTFTETVT